MFTNCKKETKDTFYSLAEALGGAGTLIDTAGRERETFRDPLWRLLRNKDLSSRVEAMRPKISLELGKGCQP